MILAYFISIDNLFIFLMTENKVDPITEECKKLLHESGALLRGHFILSSGLHSSEYVQCANIFKNHKIADKLCGYLARIIKQTKVNNKELEFDFIVSPAIGGITLGYEMSRHLDKPAIFCERRDNKFSIDRFTLPNNQDLLKGKKVLMLEDVVTTGKSVLEATKCIKDAGGIVVAIASLINRGFIAQNKREIINPSLEGTALDISANSLIALIDLVAPNVYAEDELPDELKRIPPVKLGSRKKI